jgi:hypothetical protein
MNKSQNSTKRLDIADLMALVKEIIAYWKEMGRQHFPAWFNSRSKPPLRGAPPVGSRRPSPQFKRCAKRSGHSSSALCEVIS